MWRRWIGLAVAAVLGFSMGAGLGGRLHPFLEGAGVVAAGGEARPWVLGLGALVASLAGAVGYTRGRQADVARSRRR